MRCTTPAIRRRLPKSHEPLARGNRPSASGSRGSTLCRNDGHMYHAIAIALTSRTVDWQTACAVYLFVRASAAPAISAKPVNICKIKLTSATAGAPVPRIRESVNIKPYERGTGPPVCTVVQRACSRESLLHCVSSSFPSRPFSSAPICSSTIPQRWWRPSSDARSRSICTCPPW